MMHVSDAGQDDGRVVGEEDFEPWFPRGRIRVRAVVHRRIRFDGTGGKVQKETTGCQVTARGPQGDGTADSVIRHRNENLCKSWKCCQKRAIEGEDPDVVAPDRREQREGVEGAGVVREHDRRAVAKGPAATDLARDTKGGEGARGGGRQAMSDPVVEAGEDCREPPRRQNKCRMHPCRELQRRTQFIGGEASEGRGGLQRGGTLLARGRGALEFGRTVKALTL